MTTSNSTAADEQQPDSAPLTDAEESKVWDAIVNIETALRHITGIASSIHQIAGNLPETPMEEKDRLCPELVFPPLASNIVSSANSAFNLIWNLKKLLEANETTSQAVPNSAQAAKTIELHADRAERFLAALYHIANANKALYSSMRLFPQQALADEGEIDVDTAIDSFSSIIKKNVELMALMIDGE